MRMIVAFEKSERVRHIGHLDLMRAMQRALRRSGLPIRYSQGFNPHVVLSFASPLPVGTSGSEELMDVALDAAATVDEADFAARLSQALPASLPLLRVRAVSDQHPKLMAQLKTAAYEVRFIDDPIAQNLAKAIDPLLLREEIIAIRKTKSGEKPCDIRPMLHALTAETAEGEIVFRFRVSLTEESTLKPDLLLRTLAGLAGELPQLPPLRRVGLYGEANGKPVSLMEM